MTLNQSMSTFQQQIIAFNELYKLPVLDTPGVPFKPRPTATIREQLIDRLDSFHKTLSDELDEVGEILEKIKAGDAPEEILTAIADWLGDIQVYCASEMRKFGLDNDAVLDTIMASNMSKLGADGQPIYDEHGKVLKGPNYWKPEPMLQRMIALQMKYAADQMHIAG